MKPLCASLLALLLLTGCTKGAPAPTPPAQTQQPRVLPLKVTREGDRTIVEGLSHWTVLPAADGSAFAFTTADGIWTLGPNGESLRQWVKGDQVRDMIDLTRDRLLYLERQGDQLKILKAAPEQEPVQLASVAASHIQAQGRIPTWTRLDGNRLTIAVYKEPLMQVDLTTGKVKTIGTEPLTVLTDFLSATPDGRYLLHKREHYKEPVHIYDLETGSVTQPEGEYQLYPHLSPVDDRYAVLAAEVGSGLPNGKEGAYLEGGTHIDLGQPDGTVRHLHPPERVQLRMDPAWSPDGTKLAVQALEGPVWIIDLASGEWRPINLRAPGHLTGWQDADHIMLFDGPDKQYSLPIAGGAPEPVPEVNGQVTLADGTLVYRPFDATARDSVWVRRPGAPSGVEVLGGDGTYDSLIPMGNAVAVVNTNYPDYRLIILSY